VQKSHLTVPFRWVFQVLVRTWKDLSSRLLDSLNEANIFQVGYSAWTRILEKGSISNLRLPDDYSIQT